MSKGTEIRWKNVPLVSHLLDSLKVIRTNRQISYL